VCVVLQHLRVVETRRLGVCVDSLVLLSGQAGVFHHGVSIDLLHLERYAAGTLSLCQTQEAIDVLLCAGLVVSLEILPFEERELLVAASPQGVALSGKSDLALSDGGDIFLHPRQAVQECDSMGEYVQQGPGSEGELHFW
jgi:hypothetical protein